MAIRALAGAGIALGVLLVPTGVAVAQQSPSTGQPGAPNVTCGSQGATSTPGGSTGAAGSPFNANGTSGTVYAGNPGTQSSAHSNSTASVSQYDVACEQVTSH
ncbi:MAG TPA: hypothetical protein VE991_14925 [Acidimicrobiales bacterium]|nr:hypothetical protein [Acidimicrobiales bacterium]